MGCGEYMTQETEEIFYPDIAGIVAFYQFDGNLQDSAPDSIQAASAGTPVYQADHNGVEGAALYIADGDSIWVATRGAFDITGELTVAAWIRADTAKYENAFVLDKGFSEAYAMGIKGASAPATTRLVFCLGGETLEAPWADVPLGTGNDWTHVACAFVDTQDVTYFYVNGALTDSSDQLTDLGSTTFDLRIGNSQEGDAAFIGAIDQLAIFDRALTPSEIFELYEFD